MPNDLFALLGDKLVGHLGKVLKWSRLFNAQRHPHNDKVGDEHEKHQQLHRKRVRYRRLRQGGVHVQSIQECRHWRGKMLIQKSGKK